uniref:Uncharacterized protein n=1 Tax=Anguilla anguilla TaxID=7936 RepID=A0A0E9RED4_ANGAN
MAYADSSQQEQLMFLVLKLFKYNGVDSTK